MGSGFNETINRKGRDRKTWTCAFYRAALRRRPSCLVYIYRETNVQQTKGRSRRDALTEFATQQFQVVGHFHC